MISLKDLNRLRRYEHRATAMNQAFGCLARGYAITAGRV